MRHFYALLSYLLLPWVLLRLIGAGLRNPEYFSRWRERFGIIPHRQGPQLVVWLHAVSVGEVQAATPLVRRLLAGYPGFRIVVTTMTPAGADAVRQRFGQAVAHYYLPYDIPPAMAVFIRRLRPAILILLETELWPNLLRECRRRGVPVILANARMSEHSFRGYARVASLTRAILTDIDIVAARSRADADRFLRLGAAEARVRVAGNLKYDVEPPAGIAEQARSLRRKLGRDRPVWVAGSTHEGEERQVLEAHGEILGVHPDCLLVLAPRHPERCARVADLCHRLKMPLVRHSRAGSVTAASRVYLIDRMGELPVCYAAADVAFVGGSLVTAGGHNVLEPAALGIPVLTGPHCFNFTDIVPVLAAAGAAMVVNNAGELRAAVLQLLASPDRRHAAGAAGRATVADHGGAGDEIIAILRDYLAGA